MKQPKAGDLVTFPDTRPGHRGQTIQTKFDQGGTHLLIRTDTKSNAAWWIDDNFKDQFQIDYDGVDDYGKNKWIVKLLKTPPATSTNTWEIVLFVDGKPSGTFETTAPTEKKALANAVIRWCRANNIVPHKYNLYVDLFREDMVGRYSYKITQPER